VLGFSEQMLLSNLLDPLYQSFMQNQVIWMYQLSWQMTQATLLARKEIKMP
jgi:hypothetical protein